jgi:hypothetical protein
MSKSVKNPYIPTDTFYEGAEIIPREVGKASGKAKARYPSGILKPFQDSSVAGKMGSGTRAYTPGGTPTGA